MEMSGETKVLSKYFRDKSIEKVQQKKYIPRHMVKLQSLSQGMVMPVMEREWERIGDDAMSTGAKEFGMGKA